MNRYQAGIEPESKPLISERKLLTTKLRGRYYLALHYYSLLKPQTLQFSNSFFNTSDNRKIINLKIFLCSDNQEIRWSTFMSNKLFFSPESINQQTIYFLLIFFIDTIYTLLSLSLEYKILYFILVPGILLPF